MANILIGTPAFGGLVTTDYVISLLGLQAELGKLGVDFTIQMPGNASLITVARNFIAAQVLESPEFTHLLFIDADIRFDPTFIGRYLAHNKDVVAGIYPIKHVDLEEVRRLPPDRPLPSVLRYAVKLVEGQQQVVDGFVQAEYAATGFMLIRREVLEKMAAHYPELKYSHSFAFTTKEAPVGKNSLYALFDTSIDREKGLYLPEDFTFCKRWRAMGGEIWVDVVGKFSHIGSCAYEGDFSVFTKRSPLPG